MALKSDYQISYCMIDRAKEDPWIAFVWKFIFKYEFYPPIQSSYKTISHWKVSIG